MLKIVEKYRLDEDDFRESMEITVYDGDNRVKELSFCDGEPEDNSLGRNFSDVHSISDVIRIAYEAGKAGKQLIFEESDDE